MRRFPRELTNHGGRVPAVAGNGGKPATRGDYQRGRGSQLPAVNTRRPLAKRIRGSVGQVPMPKTSRYRQEVDEEVRICSPTNPKRAAMRKDGGRIAPNTPHRSRSRSNEAPRTHKWTSQHTRKEAREKGPGAANSGPGLASSSSRPEQGLERRRGEIPRASNEHATRGGGDRAPSSEKESQADVSSEVPGLSPLRSDEENASSESDDSEPARRRGPDRSPSRANDGGVKKDPERSETDGEELLPTRVTNPSKSRSPSVPPAVAGKAPVTLAPRDKVQPEPPPTLQVQGFCGDKTRIEPNCGQCCIVYMNLTSIACLIDVAEDLRKCPAQVILVTCDSGELAIQLAAYLTMAPDPDDPSTEKPKPREKGKGREPEERVEKTFLTETYNGLLVAGRYGIVHGVEVKANRPTSGGGKLLIAELSLHRQLCHQLRLAVAVWQPARAAEDPEPAVAGPECSWDDVRNLCYRHVVRVLAGEFGTNVHPIVEHFREMYMVNAAAWGIYGGTPDQEELVVAPSFMCVIGPVLEIDIDFKSKKYLKCHTRDDGEVMGKQLTPEDIMIEKVSDSKPRYVSADDWTISWPPIHEVKQKAPSPSWGFGRRLSGGWEKDGDFSQERPPRGQS